MKRERTTELTGQLREAITSLIGSLESGVGFDGALIRYSQGADNELSRAFARVMAEVQSGVGRREAIRNLAEELDEPQVTAFVEAIIGADEQGMSVLETLKEQAEQLDMDASA